MKSEGISRRGKDTECGTRRRGAQTFRRGRAIVFYRQLESKRATLISQLESKDLQTIHPVIAGELKATEAIMNDFLELFQLNEIVEDPQED